MKYHMQEMRRGKWLTAHSFDLLSDAANLMFKSDAANQTFKSDAFDGIPRCITDNHNNVLVWGRHRPKDESATTLKPFWIVVSIDKPGPCERDGKPPYRHDTFDSARIEARRLSAACGGGRFAVMASQFVTGWSEHAFAVGDMEIPF